MGDDLALHGGERTARAPFPPWPQFAERTFQEILEPLKTGRVASWAGTRVTELEKRWADWIGSPCAVACSSGTGALDLALIALGIVPGDEVILPSHTFISTALAPLHLGALPVFCDVTDDQTLDPRVLETIVTPRTRAVIAVHLYGIVCDMEKILAAARRHGLKVVEDCAQCVGGEIAGVKAGTLGDAGCFSFSQSKHFSTGGEGGMVVTPDRNVAEACGSLRDYGRSFSDSAPGAHVMPGFNLRLTEMQAIVGVNELARLESWNLPRRAGYAKLYDHAFAQLPGVRSLPLNTSARRNAYWKYPLQLCLDKFTCDTEELRRALGAEGIPDAGRIWPEVYDEPLFSGIPSQRCANAEAVRNRTLVLALHPTWEKSHVETCISAVKKVLRAYKR